MILDGSNNHLTFEDCVFEGRNATTPCFGALVRDASSYSDYINCTFNYAMTAPGSGADAGDLGYIHFTNGTHNLIGCHTRLANANTIATTATVYATGSNTYVNVVGFIGEGNASALPINTQGTGVRFKPRVVLAGGATGDADSTVTGVISATSPPTPVTFFIDGNATLGATDPQMPLYGNWVLLQAAARARTGPVGANLIFDVNVNGSTVWSNAANRLRIVAGATSGVTTVFNNPVVPDGSVITLDVDGIGVSTPGADITVVLWMVPA
jgi:hypothetical protein